MFLLTLILGALALALVFALAARRPFSILDAFRPRPPALARWAFAAVLGFVLFSPRLALAATGAPGQTLNLALIWGWVLSFATAALAVYGRRALIALEGRLNIQSGSAAADDLDQALVHGEAFLMNGLKVIAATTSTVTIPAGPIANAVQLVQKLAPAAEVALGITPADIENMLLARIGAKAPGAPVVSEPTPAPSPAINPAPAPAS